MSRGDKLLDAVQGGGQAEHILGRNTVAAHPRGQAEVCGGAEAGGQAEHREQMLH